MDGLTLIALTCGVLAGGLLGALAAWTLTRARCRGDQERLDQQLDQSRADLVRAQALAAETRSDAVAARAEAVAARGETAAARGEAAAAVSEARADIAEARAEARAEASAAQAEASEVSAALAKACAERDAALARAQLIAEDRESIANHFKVLAQETLELHGRAAEVQSAQRHQATEQVMAPVRESLERFNTRLTEVEKERASLSAELRTQVCSVQQAGEALRKETAALVTALRKPQVRGSWGETQLRRVAELAGMLDRCDFDLQHTTRADERLMRPDMIVHLAEGRHVFVDSKVPLNAFLDAAATEDEQLRAEALVRYARNVRTHIDQLSSKQYWKADDTPEFVVLFLPNEAFFSTALDQIPDLYEYAAGRDVVLATPTTMIALLRAVAYGWKQAALAESAAEVFRLGRDLHEKLGLMGGRLDKLGRALRSSVNAYNDTVATVEGTVLVRARRFKDLRVTDKDLGPLTQVEDAVRQVQAAELVDDAVQVAPIIGRTRRHAVLGSAPSPRTGPDASERPGSEPAAAGPAATGSPASEPHASGPEASRPSASRASASVPEAAELVRGDPDLLDLVQDDRPRAAGDTAQLG